MTSDFGLDGGKSQTTLCVSVCVAFRLLTSIMAQNGQNNAPGAIVPTNSVSVANGSNIKARIDPSLSVAEVNI